MGAALFSRKEPPEQEDSVKELPDLKPKILPPQKSMSISTMQVLPWDGDRDDVGLSDINVDMIEGRGQDIAEYCLPLLVLHFCGQTSSTSKENATDEDKTANKKVLSLKNYLKMLDRWLRQFENVRDFTGEEEEFQLFLRLIAMKRHRKHLESVDDCYERLIKDSRRFVKVYHERGVPSEELETSSFWGSRQQLLAGKVIADWVDEENGPLDPIFGVLLQPTAGRVGPGDTGWFHDILFDDRGHMAYHSAVHDGFGYLITAHNTGPGYDYLNGSTWFETKNCMAGQIPGISFWSRVIEEIETKQKVLEYWRC